MEKKNINKRCPLSTECDRKHCDFISHEIDCVYYESNGWGDNSIPDQEERRNERSRVREEALYEAEPASPKKKPQNTQTASTSKDG